MRNAKYNKKEKEKKNMALTDENMVMPVSPMYNNGGGFGRICP